MFKKPEAPISKLPLRAFYAAIAQSMRKANEMLERDHLAALLRCGIHDAALPPPTSLMICSAKVTFSGNVTQSRTGNEENELQIDLTNPNGNFSAELELTPFDDAMLTALREMQQASPSVLGHIMPSGAPMMPPPPMPGNAPTMPPPPMPGNTPTMPPPPFSGIAQQQPGTAANQIAPPDDCGTGAMDDDLDD